MSKITAKDIGYLEQHYPNTDTAQLAKKLGWPINKVHATAHRFGITKTEEYMESIKPNGIYRSPKNNRKLNNAQYSLTPKWYAPF